MADPRHDDEFASYAASRPDAGSPDHGDGQGGEDGRTANVSEWYEREPSGWRRRVSKEEAEKLVIREKAQQTIEQANRQVNSFEGTQFVGHLAGSDIKFNRNGDLVVQFVVPYQFKALALPLTDVFGIPLHIDVQIWKPFEDKAS